MRLRALRRDRAFRSGPALFLHERAFDDCLDRLSLIARQFQSALLVGCPDPGWPDRIRARVREVDVIDPGPLFATAAGGRVVDEEQWTSNAASYDLVVAIGTLDTVNDLPAMLRRLRGGMTADALLIGAIAGGDTLPRLRSAMFAADQARGSASPRVHPRIDGPSLATLLGATGFTMPVVDIDRVALSYESLSRLIADLRAMAATNLLAARDRTAISRSARQVAEQAFGQGSDGGRVIEQVEILHFAAWTPADRG